MRPWSLIALAVSAAVLVACGGGGGADAASSFAAPADGDAVASPVDVQMEATGFEVAPAEGSGEGQGHFHVVVDAECVADGQTIPSDDTHLHFGDGSTSAQVELEPGEHTLCVQAGDATHTAFGGTDQITVTVE